MMSIADDLVDQIRAGQDIFLAGVRSADENSPSARKLAIAVDALRRIALPAGDASGLETDMEKAMRLCAQAALDRIEGSR